MFQFAHSNYLYNKYLKTNFVMNDFKNYQVSKDHNCMLQRRTRLVLLDRKNEDFGLIIKERKQQNFPSHHRALQLVSDREKRVD